MKRLLSAIALCWLAFAAYAANPTFNSFTNTGTNIFYVSTTGNDSTAVPNNWFLCYRNPYTAALAAGASFAAGFPNNTVYINPGVYDMGTNSIIVTNNLTIFGQSATNTIIQSKVGGTSNAIVGCYSGVTVDGITIAGTLGGSTTTQIPFGCISGQYTAGFTGSATIRNCIISNDSDGIFVSTTSGANTLYVNNCNIRTHWDVIVTGGNTVGTNSQIWVNNCDLGSDGNSAIVAGQGQARVIYSSGNAVFIKNSILHATNASGGPDSEIGCLRVDHVNAAIGFIDAQNCTLDTPSTNAPSITHADISVSGTQTSTIRAINCRRMDNQPLQVFKSGASTVLSFGPPTFDSITIGLPTNSNSFTFVQTNWIDGNTNNVNNTGRPILVGTPIWAQTATNVGSLGYEAFYLNGAPQGFGFSVQQISLTNANGITNGGWTYLVPPNTTFGWSNLSQINGTAGLKSGGWFLVQ